jgi:hypothetical protein
MNKIILIIVVLLVIVSCDLMKYQPSESNYQEVDTTQVNNPYIDLMNTPDTLYFADYTTIFIDTDREIYNIELYLNDELIYDWHGYHPIHIETWDMEAGIYEAKFIIEMSSGTGSIADILEMERIEVEILKTVIIDNEDPSPIELDPIEWPQNSNIVEIIWTRNTDDNFTYYVLERQCEFYEETLIDTIYNRNITTYHDTLDFLVYGTNILFYEIFAYKINGKSSTDYQSLGYEHTLPLPTTIYSGYNILKTRPVVSDIYDEFYIKHYTNQEIVAISNSTHNIVKTTASNFASSEKPNFTVSADGTKLYCLNTQDDDIKVITTSDFDYHDNIDLTEPGYHPGGPVATDENFFFLNYVNSLYGVNLTTLERNYLGCNYLHKVVINDDYTSLFALYVDGSEYHISKFDILSNEVTLSNDIIINNEWQTYVLQLNEDNSLLYTIGGSDRINIYSTDNLEYIDNISVDITNPVDEIYDFYINDHTIFISYSQKRPDDYFATFGKVIEYDINTGVFGNEFYFEDTPNQIFTTKDQSILYAITITGTMGSSQHIGNWIIPLMED